MGESNLLFESVFNRKLSADTTREYITQITNEYPYFSIAQFYLLLLSGKGTKNFEQQAAKTSIFFNNAWWLQFQLQEMQQQHDTSIIAADLQIPTQQQEESTVFQAIQPVVPPDAEATLNFNEPVITTNITESELPLTVEETELLQPENFTPPFIEDIPDFTLPPAETFSEKEYHLEETTVASEILPVYSEPPVLPITTEEKESFEVPVSSPVSTVEEKGNHFEEAAVAVEIMPVFNEPPDLPKTTEVEESYVAPIEIPAQTVDEKENHFEETAVATEIIPLYSEPPALPITTVSEASFEAPIEIPVSTVVENKEEIIGYIPSENADNVGQPIVNEPDKADEFNNELDVTTEIPDSIVVENPNDKRVNNQVEHFNNDSQPLVNEPDTAGDSATEPEIAPLNFKLNINTGNTNEDTITFEPLHTTDYFASLGIKLSGDVTPNDKLGKQLKSFTEWLKTMKKVHPDQLPVQSAAADISIQNLAEKSNKEDAVVTEAMAEVLLQQGKTQKAIEVFKKLSLLNPSKSAYFAAKIDQLNEH